jgi:hypothetical protein
MCWWGGRCDALWHAREGDQVSLLKVQRWEGEEISLFNIDRCWRHELQGGSEAGKRVAE